MGGVMGHPAPLHGETNKIINFLDFRAKRGLGVKKVDRLAYKKVTKSVTLHPGVFDSLGYRFIAETGFDLKTVAISASFILAQAGKYQLKYFFPHPEQNINNMANLNEFKVDYDKLFSLDVQDIYRFWNDVLFTIKKKDVLEIAPRIDGLFFNKMSIGSDFDALKHPEMDTIKLNMGLVPNAPLTLFDAFYISGYNDLLKPNNLLETVYMGIQKGRFILICNLWHDERFEFVFPIGG